jgi:chemotaxis protein MotA
MANKNQSNANTFDFSTLFGISLAFIFIIYAISVGGNASAFIDGRSISIVLLSTFAVVLACFSFRDLMALPGAVIRTVIYQPNDIRHAAIRSIETVKYVYLNNVMKLETVPQLYSHNQFFKEGIELLMDQSKIEEVTPILEHKIHSLIERHSKSVDVLKKAGEVSPAMGLIGTLIGLVQMLGSLNDVDSIGPAMAVALLTTFYGAIMAYMVFLPLSSKLERNTNHEMLIMQIYFEAIQSVAKKENPRKLEALINGMLPLTKRIHYIDPVK